MHIVIYNWNKSERNDRKLYEIKVEVRYKIEHLYLRFVWILHVINLAAHAWDDWSDN